MKAGKRFIYFRNFALYLQKNINRIRLLNKLDNLVTETHLKTYNSEVNDPVFLVGPPRTGSTLLFQLLLNSFHFSYVSNITSFFYSCPTKEMS